MLNAVVSIHLHSKKTAIKKASTNDLAEASQRLRLKVNPSKDLTAFPSNVAEALSKLRQSNPDEPLSPRSPPPSKPFCVPPSLLSPPVTRPSQGLVSAARAAEIERQAAAIVARAAAPARGSSHRVPSPGNSRDDLETFSFTLNTRTMYEEDKIDSDVVLRTIKRLKL
ncbi:hypothetical protein MMC07_009584 [Pseudocyphellaria aurata]|nr:hypothetical protein [Pseudocyphellaria aurata]